MPLSAAFTHDYQGAISEMEKSGLKLGLTCLHYCVTMPVTSLQFSGCVCRFLLTSLSFPNFRLDFKLLDDVNILQRMKMYF